MYKNVFGNTCEQSYAVRSNSADNNRVLLNTTHTYENENYIKKPLKLNTKNITIIAGCQTCVVCLCARIFTHEGRRGKRVRFPTKNKCESLLYFRQMPWAIQFGFDCTLSGATYTCRKYAAVLMAHLYAIYTPGTWDYIRID